VAASLVDAGARVTLYGRDRARVERRARELGAASADLASLPDAPWDVLVQATPLGSFLRSGGSAFCLTLRLDRRSAQEQQSERVGTAA